MTEHFPEEQGLRVVKEHGILMERLAGNQALKRFRSKREGDPGQKELLIDPKSLMMAADNPSAFRKTFKEQAADLESLLNIACQLKRDGNVIAAETLLRSLEKGLPLPGEEEPITDVMEISFILPEAEKALFAIKQVLNNLKLHENQKDWKTRIQDLAELVEIFVFWPELKYQIYLLKDDDRRIFERNMTTISEALPIILDKLSQEFLGQDKQILEKDTQVRLLIEYGNHTSITYRNQDALGVSFQNVKQIKSQIGRDVQKRMAVWTIKVPTYVYNHLWKKDPIDNQQFKILLFPEKALELFYNAGKGYLSPFSHFGYMFWLGDSYFWDEKEANAHFDIKKACFEKYGVMPYQFSFALWRY